MAKLVVFPYAYVTVLLILVRPSWATPNDEDDDYIDPPHEYNNATLVGCSPFIAGSIDETPDDWEPPADPVGTTPRSSYKLEKPLNGPCPSLSRACIALCTPPNNTLDKLQFPPIFDSLTMVPSHLDVVMSPNSQNESVSVFVWDPCPDAAKTVYDLTIQQVAIKVLDNGSLYFVHDNRLISSKDYCLILDDGVTAMECNVRTDSWLSRLGQILTLICLFMSVMCAVATLIVYWFLPEFNNMHGMIFRSYIASCAFAYTLTLLSHLRDEGSINSDICTIVGFIKYFVFMANFCWLNIMCYDIWRTMRSFRITKRKGRRFAFYSLYAWGCPLAISGIAIICTYMPDITNFLKPSFKGRFCCFTDPATAALYFDGPVAISNIANIYLFISTARKILQTERDTEKELSGDDSQRHANDKQRLYIRLKLFILTGINWTIEMFAVFIEYWMSPRTMPNEIWKIVSFVHSLQGIIIFFVFIWNDNTKRLLIQRYNRLACVQSRKL